MMPFFEVQPDVLTGQAPVIIGQANTLALLEQQLRMIAGSAAATGFEDAAAALERFSVVASTRTGLVREAVAGIGAMTGQSGDAYAAVEYQTVQDIAEAGDRLAGAAD
jgi:hypothetical protein